MSLRTTTALLLAVSCLTAPLKADIAGPYLAARQASIAADYEQAVEYYARAVVEDPTNLALLESAVIANVAAGNLDPAGRVANSYVEAGGTNPIVLLTKNVAALKAGNFELADQPNTQNEGLAPLLNGLLEGWAHLGKGQMSDATAAFEKVAEVEDFAQLAYYHQALALALVGDFESADQILSGERHGPLTLSARGIEAHAQVLMQLERPDDALALLTATAEASFNPVLDALKTSIEAGEAAEYSFATTPQEGAAEVLFTISTILQGRASPELVLLYARLAAELHPNHSQAKLLAADVLDQIGQYQLAVDTFSQVPADDPAAFLAEMGRANALYSDNQEDAAIEVLSALAKSYPENPSVHAALGDYLGRQDREAEAIEAYTRAIDLRADDDIRAWPVYYARGIVHERMGNLPEMEVDFRKALELSPNQPDVLNYLGYSLIEQQVKLDEALAMIETAVVERPESGYITDSLGWVFYRLGRFEEAVAPMERAVSLLPVDPIVNDHLGDVYWKVDRKREAEFQWKRALSFEPEEAEAERIRRKLEVGLDVVLEEEAAQ